MRCLEFLTAPVFHIFPIRILSDPDPGHEDLDQIFSVVASLISRYEFSSPDELVDILDSAGRPEAEVGEQERKRTKKNFTVDCQAYKLDQVARWHEWVSVLGVRVKGLRELAVNFCRLKL